jgi:ribosomal protein S18 acetylase RimI-like enzyme
MSLTASNVKIRPAVASDASGVARVHVQTWQTAYRGVVPDAYLDSLSVTQREKFWRESIARGTPELLVAEVDSQVVGWASFGPSRDPGVPRGTGELEAIYVLPDYWGTGAGRALWLMARSRLIERGFAAATLWVLMDNARAIRFYRAAGFVPEAATEKQLEVGGKSLGEIRFGMTFRQ